MDYYSFIVRTREENKPEQQEQKED